MTNYIMTGVSIVLMLFIFVFMVELVLPINMEAEFSTICREYYLIIEKEGGLSVDERNDLEKDLREAGFIVENISYAKKNEVAKNDRILFEVDCIYKTEEISGITKRDSKDYHFIFEKQIISRKIIN